MADKRSKRRAGKRGGRKGAASAAPGRKRHADPAGQRNYRALAASQERYRRFFEIASDWFWETDRNYRFTYVSPSIEVATGLPIVDYLGKRLSEMEGVDIPREEGLRVIAAQKAKEPYRDFRYSRRRSDGSTVWISSNGTPVFDDDGAFAGYCGIARDVTAQAEVERALRDNERQWRQVLEAVADYYYEEDLQHRVKYLSPNFEQVMGFPASEWLGKRVSDVPNLSSEPEMGTLVLRAFKERKPYRDYIFSRKRADGTRQWIKVSGAPAYDRNGVYCGYRGAGADVTAHVQVELAAKLAQQQLQEAVAYVAQPIVVFDDMDRAVVFNQAYIDLHKMPGVFSPVARGLSFHDLAEWQIRSGFFATPPGDPPLGIEALLARYRSEAEYVSRLYDGRWMLVAYHRLPGGGRVGLWTDVTALKRAEEQLHHSQRLEALGTLAGGVAHEINNALVPVIALTKMAAGKLAEGSRERRNLETVLSGAERSRDLVRQILAFSRKEEEARRRERIALQDVLDQALRLMRATLPASIRLEEEIAPVPPLLGDAQQLEQVIINLVTNAAQAIGEAQGKITVGLGAEEETGYLRLSIADTGCGMDDATIARIFEPFFTTKSVGEGTGLGLSVAHGIVKEHGGRIEVKSRPGEGARFDIFLPILRAQQAA